MDYKQTLKQIRELVMHCDTYIANEDIPEEWHLNLINSIAQDEVLIPLREHEDKIRDENLDTAEELLDCIYGKNEWP